MVDQAIHSQAIHPIVVRGVPLGPSDTRANRLTGVPTGSSPTIVQRTEQEFIPTVLDELRSPAGRAALAQTVATNRDADNVLRLFQPVHRTFHLALCEVACDTFGQPRLDPQQIDSAGLVVRRVALNANGNPLPERLEGWRKAGEQIRGWVGFPSLDEQQRDPDPERRPLGLRFKTGHPDLDQRLSLLTLAEPLAEQVSPLFVAPPEVCQAAKRTIVYGLISVTSAEFSETPAALPPYSADDVDQLREHMPDFLKALPRGVRYQVPRRDQTLSADDAAAEELQDFVTQLSQLRVEFKAFDQDPVSPLFAQLNQLRVIHRVGTQAVGDFLRQAARVLVEGEPGETVRMPLVWPRIEAAQAEAMFQTTLGVLREQLASLVPNEGRFDAADRQYRLQAFVRVKRDEDCPPELVWSQPSEPFTIVPWYEGGRTPPVRVSLPNALDRDFLEKLKPSVAFEVPKDLFNFLQATKLKDLSDGTAPEDNGNGPVLDWICGFNIPIITFCAFIVLNIFLQLMNFIFWWLPFVKICIPFPRRR